MAAETNIEWSDATMNFWMGCTKIGAACVNCYAETWALRHKLDIFGSHAQRKRTAPGNWTQPDKWNREADPRVPRLVFTNSLADFWDNQVPQEWRVEAVDVMWRTPRLHWLILTKRPQNIVKLMPTRGLPPNVSLGISAANQHELDRDARWIEAAVHEAQLGGGFFLSLEPMVDRIDPTDAIRRGASWIIAGGESGEGARVSEPDWFRVVRDVCAVRRVPFLFKQWGEWVPAPKTIDEGEIRERDFAEAARFAGGRPFVPLATGETMIRAGKKKAGRHLDGRTHTEFPAAFNRARKDAL